MGQVVRSLEGLIVQADPALAAERARALHEARLVQVGEHRDGGSMLYARLDTEDALALDHTIGRLCEVLSSAGGAESVEQRRATALGMLADPQAAWELLNGCGDGRSRGRSATVVVHLAADTLYPDPDGHLDPAPWNRYLAGLPRPGTAACPGSSAGTDSHDPGSGRRERVPAVARVEGVGPLDVETLKRFLGGCTVVVRPVIDLNTIPAVDSYEIPQRLRQHVLARNPVEVFPYSARPSTSCDLDHTIPYQPDAPPGAAQTRAENLGPLSRRTHRAKTAGLWKVEQYEPGHFTWTSPQGFRYEVTPWQTIALGRPAVDHDECEAQELADFFAQARQSHHSETLEPGDLEQETDSTDTNVAGGDEQLSA